VPGCLKARHGPCLGSETSPSGSPGPTQLRTTLLARSRTRLAQLAQHGTTRPVIGSFTNSPYGQIPAPRVSGSSPVHSRTTVRSRSPSTKPNLFTNPKSANPSPSVSPSPVCPNISLRNAHTHGGACARGTAQPASRLLHPPSVYLSCCLSSITSSRTQATARTGPISNGASQAGRSRSHLSRHTQAVYRERDSTVCRLSRYSTSYSPLPPCSNVVAIANADGEI
jgi:hypothetical protein